MGNLNSRTFTNEDGTATMTHYVESDCYWFNPFCNNHAQTVSIAIVHDIIPTTNYHNKYVKLHYPFNIGNIYILWK